MHTNNRRTQHKWYLLTSSGLFLLLMSLPCSAWGGSPGGGPDPPEPGHHGARRPRLRAGQAAPGSPELHQEEVPAGKAGLVTSSLAFLIQSPFCRRVLTSVTFSTGSVCVFQVVTRLIHLLGQKILQQVNGPLTGVCVCVCEILVMDVCTFSCRTSVCVCVCVPQLAAWPSTRRAVSGTPAPRPPTCAR